MSVIEPIAKIYTVFSEKFGVPRQSGLVCDCARIVFEPAYRNPQALRGLENFSHIWLIWEFSQAAQNGWSPTVRPPRLGGNVRMGVFATRSPFRPNSLALSSIRLERIEYDTPEGAVLHVSGADMVSGTPVFDIKPYLPFTDSHPDAKDGFAAETKAMSLEVVFENGSENAISQGEKQLLIEILSGDPRPHYQHDPERIYAFEAGGMHISFRVQNSTLTVTDIKKESGGENIEKV